MTDYQETSEWSFGDAMMTEEQRKIAQSIIGAQEATRRK